uniref:AMP-dependent synthetase/ligase domain-containing protein n=1 Tax=Musa acuminata subsp. malaccensis TaxID=214687 RepID=A0A804JWI0_MUSAM|nr:PREDICTED: 4-coumarate--CoA ligase-like 4 [Musa acuminata subsp. malaccensis]
MDAPTLVEHLKHEEEDTQSGFCPRSGIFRSLHRLAPRHRPPSDPSLDAASFVFSLLPSHESTRPVLLDSTTGRRLTFSDLRRSALSLAAALHHAFGLRPGDVVLLLSPNTVLYPVIVLAVLATGAVLCPASPLHTPLRSPARPSTPAPRSPSPLPRRPTRPPPPSGSPPSSPNGSQGTPTDRRPRRR